MGADRGLTARYEQLAVLAEAESAAAIAGELDRLAELAAQRDALRATLPATAPAAARPALERAFAAQQRADHALRVGVAETRASLVRIEQGRASVQAYGGAATPTIDATS